MDELEKRKFLAEARKLEAEATRVEKETLEMEKRASVLWYLAPRYLQALFAALVAVPIIWFYVENIVVPLTKIDSIEKELSFKKEIESSQKKLEQIATASEKKIFSDIRNASIRLDDEKEASSCSKNWRAAAHEARRKTNRIGPHGKELEKIDEEIASAREELVELGSAALKAADFIRVHGGASRLDVSGVAIVGDLYIVADDEVSILEVYRTDRDKTDWWKVNEIAVNSFAVNETEELDIETRELDIEGLASFQNVLFLRSERTR